MFLKKKWKRNGKKERKKEGRERKKNCDDDDNESKQVKDIINRPHFVFVNR